MPKVSVILPTYNERENIGELIAEILKNVKPAPEIIVVDDYSPDKIWRIVEEVTSARANSPKLKRAADNQEGEKGIGDGRCRRRSKINETIPCMDRQRPLPASNIDTIADQSSKRM